MLDNQIQCCLGDLAYLKNGFAFKSTKYRKSGMPVLRISNIDNKKVDVSNAVCVEEASEFNEFKVFRGDILIAMSGATTGKFGLYTDGKPAYQNQRVGNLKLFSDSSMSKKFLFYFLFSAKREIEKRAYGGAQPNISAQKIESIPIVLFPFEEQHRIVAKIEELFSEIDKGVESLQTAKAQLQVYRQALLKHAFEGKLTAQWRADNPDKVVPAAQLLSQIKQAREERYQQQLADWKTAVEKWELGGQREKKSAKPKNLKSYSALDDSITNALPSCPQSWIWEKLGWMTLGVEYGTSAKSAKSGKVPVLRMGNIQNGKFEWGDLAYTSDQTEIEKYLLRLNDVLFNRTNSPELVGKTAIYKAKQPAIFAGYLIRVNQSTDFVNADYLNYYLNSYFSKNYGNSVKTDGVNQSNINGEKLSNYPFPYCSVAEQRAIVAVLDEKLSECDNSLSTISYEIDRADALRQSILKKAFSGQLVPQDPNDEPASQLLARIKAEKAARDAQPKSKATKTIRKSRKSL